jgi:hypothetical protein
MESADIDAETAALFLARGHRQPTSLQLAPSVSAKVVSLPAHESQIGEVVIDPHRTEIEILTGLCTSSSGERG